MSENSNQRNSLYPQVIESKPEACSSNSSCSSSLYPKIEEVGDLVENLFPDNTSPSALPVAVEEVLIKVPGAILHLIDKDCSVELACGNLTVICLRQRQSLVAVYARVGDEIQWPLAKDEAAVKVDDSHYFSCPEGGIGFGFLLKRRGKSKTKEEEEEEQEQEQVLNYGWFWTIG